VISEAPIKIREGNAHASPSKAPTVLLPAPSRPTRVIQVVGVHACVRGGENDLIATSG
jgi:hypothetical protein